MVVHLHANEVVSSNLTPIHRSLNVFYGLENDVVHRARPSQSLIVSPVEYVWKKGCFSPPHAGIVSHPSSVSWEESHRRYSL